MKLRAGSHLQDKAQELSRRPGAGPALASVSTCRHADGSGSERGGKEKGKEGEKSPRGEL